MKEKKLKDHENFHYTDALGLLFVSIKSLSHSQPIRSLLIKLFFKIKKTRKSNETISNYISLECYL